MKDERSFDDPLINLRMHESTAQLLIVLLRALSELTEAGDNRVSASARSFLMQATDSAADLDLLFGELADELQRGLGGT
jgi:hypothetical protein